MLKGDTFSDLRANLLHSSSLYVCLTCCVLENGGGLGDGLAVLRDDRARQREIVRVAVHQRLLPLRIWVHVHRKNRSEYFLETIQMCLSVLAAASTATYLTHELEVGIGGEDQRRLHKVAHRIVALAAKQDLRLGGLARDLDVPAKSINISLQTVTTNGRGEACE